MDIIKGANLTVRFLLELCALAALGYWGFQTGRTMATMVILGVGTPLFAALIWGTMVAPEAPIIVPATVRLLLELAVFGSALAALIASERAHLAWALAVAYVINRVLMAVWGQ